MSVSQGDRGPAPAGDRAFDRPNLVTDMCKNVDLPLAAFNMNHLVRSCLLFLRKLREELSRCHLFFFLCSSMQSRTARASCEQSPDAVFTFIFAYLYSSFLF